MPVHACKALADSKQQISWIGLAAAVQYNELAEEYLGKWGGYFAMLVNVLALCALGITQVLLSAQPCLIALLGSYCSLPAYNYIWELWSIDSCSDKAAGAQIIACSSDVHILGPDLDKRDWALIFGVRTPCTLLLDSSCRSPHDRL